MALEKSLPVETRVEWRRRTTVDKLILLDWFSETLAEGSPIFHLREALFKWNMGESYACGRPELLRGGFDDFLIRYPMMVTDSKRGRALSKERRAGGQKEAAIRQALPTLANVNFPRFENGVLVEEKVVNPAFSSGAITVTRGPQPPPSIPSRATKPTLAPTAASTPTHQELLDDSYEDTSDYDDDEEEDDYETRPPPIDRSSKVGLSAWSKSRFGEKNLYL